MKLVLLCKTNKDKSTKFHLFSLNHLAHAMPRAKKGQQKVPILKNMTGLCPSWGLLLYRLATYQALDVRVVHS